METQRSIIIFSFLTMMLFIAEISSYCKNGLPNKLMLIRQYKSHQQIRHDSRILNNYGLAMHQPQYSTSKVFKTLFMEFSELTLSIMFTVLATRRE